jgi:hypothetical protein
MSTVSDLPPEVPTPWAELQIKVQPTGIEARLSATGPRASAFLSSAIGIAAAPLIVFLSRSTLDAGWTVTLTLVELLVSLTVTAIFATNGHKGKRGVYGPKGAAARPVTVCASTRGCLNDGYRDSALDETE